MSNGFLMTMSIYYYYTGLYTYIYTTPITSGFTIVYYIKYILSVYLIYIYVLISIFILSLTVSILTVVVFSNYTINLSITKLSDYYCWDLSYMYICNVFIFIFLVSV